MLTGFKLGRHDLNQTLPERIILGVFSQRKSLRGVQLRCGVGHPPPPPGESGRSRSAMLAYSKIVKSARHGWQTGVNNMLYDCAAVEAIQPRLRSPQPTTLTLEEI